MRRLSQLLILLACVLAPLLAHAQRDPVTLNPKTYASPAGVYSCVIDPTDRDGAGVGNYLIKKNGRKVWNGKKPFTLYDARITDEGIISGYAYTYGYEGYRENAQRGDYGELLIVIMRANGDLILNKSIKREFCGRMHWPPTPIGKGLIISGEQEDILISLDACGEIEAQTYELKTGKLTEKQILSALDWHKIETASRSQNHDSNYAATESPVFPEKPLRFLGKISLTNAENEDSLGRIVTAAVSQNGHAYLVDHKTRAVHAFDTTGKQIQSYIPQPFDISKFNYSAKVHVSTDGDVYLQPDMMEPIIHFANNGGRIGTIELKLDFTEDYYPLPGDKNLVLVLGCQKAYLATSDGKKATRIIERDPANNWLEQMTCASVAANGTFAIFTGSSYGNQHWWVHLYDAKGRPIRTVTMPKGLNESGFLYTGKYLAAHSDTAVHLLTDKGKPVLKFSIPNQKLDQENVDFFAPYKGKELWILNRTDKTILRYAMP